MQTKKNKNKKKKIEKKGEKGKGEGERTTCMAFSMVRVDLVCWQWVSRVVYVVDTSSESVMLNPSK